MTSNDTQQPTKIDTTWYEAALTREGARRDAARSILGDEQLVFAWAIERIAAILDAVCAGRSISDKPTKAKLAIAHGAYSLLWSAWLEALSGRLGAALDHWRSIGESPDFMKAIHAFPDLGIAFFDGRLRPKAVRQRLREIRAREESKASASSWHTSRSAEEKMVESFSHVTANSMIVTMPLEFSSDDGPLAYVREGFDATAKRAVFQYLAAQAMVVHWTCVEVFADRTAIAALCTDEAKSFRSHLADLLERAIESGTRA
jgi:hypothetical protein